MSPPVPIAGSVGLFVVACWVVDVGTRRIPNLLCGPAICVGLLLNGLLLGWSGLLSSLSGVAVAVAILLAPFALGGIGGGDVKMMAAVGALLGPRLTLASLIAGMILGGVIVVFQLARLGRLREKLTRLRSMLVAAFLARSPEPLRVSADEPAAVALPYSIPLGLGTLAVLALGLQW
jgi:prepilin peptidase CpaA